MICLWGAEVCGQFANYLVQEMQSSDHLGSSDEASDEEDEGGWLAQSTFELRPPPVTARAHDNGRRPLSSTGFEVLKHEETSDQV